MNTTPQPLSGSTGLDRLFATLRRSPVTRSSDRLVAGVCTGLALKLGVSVKVVRVLAVVAALLGPALVLYLAAWLLLPDDQGRVRLEGALRGGETSSIVLLVATLLVLLPDAGVHARVGWLVPLVVVGAVGWFLWSRRGRTGTSGSPGSPGSTGYDAPTPPQATAPSGPSYGAAYPAPPSSTAPGAAGSGPSLVKGDPSAPQDRPV